MLARKKNMSSIPQRSVNLSNILKVGGDKSGTSYINLSAAMLFPTKPGLQLEYMREIAMPSIRPHKGITINPPPFSNSIVESFNNGVLAGTYLMFFLTLAMREIRTGKGQKANPSRNVVLHICSEYNLGRPGRAGGSHSDYPTIIDKITRANWDAYKSVSHIWAAYIHLRELPIKPDPFSDVLEDIPISVLLLLARQYERFIVQYFDGEFDGKIERECITPFQVRYHDWNTDDPLPIKLEIPEYIVDIVTDAAKSYTADTR
jgi:hypothetical protein